MHGSSWWGRCLAMALPALALTCAAGCGRQQVRAATPAMAPGYPAPAPTGGRTGQASLPGVQSDQPLTLSGGRLLSTEEGLASWYGTVYDRKRGADGTVYDQDAMTAASRTLPLGVLARVTNLADGQVAIVRITDRGPFVPGRILDLSRAAARAVGLDRMGVGKVRVEAYAEPGFREPPPRWCLQIGAFAAPEDARQLRNDLLLHYPAAKVIAFDGPTGSWVRLTLPSPERERTADVAATVKVPDPGVEAYVTRIN